MAAASADLHRTLTARERTRGERNRKPDYSVSSQLVGELAAGAMNNCSSTSIVQRDALRNPRQWQTLPPYPQRSKDVQMLRKLRPPNIAGLAVSMLTLPLQASAASNATGLRTAAGVSSGAEQAHYFRRYHRGYR